jgi:cell division protein FtsI (penicillin-binding protein 3)
MADRWRLGLWQHHGNRPMKGSRSRRPERKPAGAKQRIWKRGDGRLFIVGLAFVVAWVGMGFRLFDLQGAQAVELATRGFNQRIREVAIPAPRGTIYDRDGVEFALTVDGWNVVVDPQLLDDPAEAASALAQFSGRDVSTLTDELIVAQSTGSRYEEIAVRIRNDQKATIADVVDEADLMGVFYRSNPLRIYPAGSVAAQVIGLTRYDDGAGIEGLEKAFDSELVGDSGRLIVERDPYGRVIPQGETLVDPATPGSDIVTTIDREIQYAAEQALAGAVARTNAIGGSVVVMNPETGEILAMANWPAVDLNDRSSYDAEAMRNRAATDIFEPGSTLKTVTVSAALEEGVVTPDTPIDTPKTVTIGEFDYTDHGYNPPWMPVKDVVKKSSNVGTIEIERRLGRELHYKYLTEFGLGTTAAVDVEGERYGLLPPTSEWNNTTGSSIGIGYAIGTTAIQMAAVYSTIANDGVWTEPFLVKEIRPHSGSVIVTRPRTRTVLSPETAQTMRWMLGRVVEDNGTGRRAYMDAYTAGGKTGTTNKFDTEIGQYVEATNASFIGMAPLDDPKVVVAIVMDSPSGFGSDGVELNLGGASAAPVFREVAQAALHQLGVPPDRN